MSSRLATWCDHRGTRAVAAPRRWCAVLALVFTIGIVGCGPSAPPRVRVAGAITLDGKPLDHASILFRPLKGVAGPQGGGKVVQGKYDIPQEFGPAVGKLKVQIWSDSDAGGTPSDIQRKEPPPKPFSLPARYNKASTLHVETTLDGPNQFNFELTSDK